MCQFICQGVTAVRRTYFSVEIHGRNSSHSCKQGCIWFGFTKPEPPQLNSRAVKNKYLNLHLLGNPEVLFFLLSVDLALFQESGLKGRKEILTVPVWVSLYQIPPYKTHLQSLSMNIIKLQDIKLTQKSVAFLYTNNEKTERN